METTTTTDDLNYHSEPEKAIILTDEAQYFLQKAGQWANFLGIVGFIFCGLIALLAFFAGSIFAAASQANPMMASFAGMGSMITIIYLLMALLYFFPSLYLFQFASKVKQAILLTDKVQLTAAMSKLKSFFKFWGILMIVILGLYALIFLGVMIGVGIGASHH